MDAPLRAGEREADFVAAPFDAALFDAGPDFVAAPFEAALDLDGLLLAPALALLVGAAFIPVFEAPALVLVAAPLPPELAPFDAGAAFFVLLDAPPELEPDLRDFVVLSAITRLLSAFA